MYIDDFVWLTEIASKVATKHRVTPDEAEEVFFNNPRYRFVESGHRAGEDVYSAGGQTDAGRYLQVVYSPDPAGDSVFVITAYPLTGKALQAYRRRQRR